MLTSVAAASPAVCCLSDADAAPRSTAAAMPAAPSSNWPRKSKSMSGDIGAAVRKEGRGRDAVMKEKEEKEDVKAAGAASGCGVKRWSARDRHQRG